MSMVGVSEKAKGLTPRRSHLPLRGRAVPAGSPTPLQSLRSLRGHSRPSVGEPGGWTQTYLSAQATSTRAT